ncbi:MAG TPA: glycosyltransferase [Vicinamibacterales bacterium]|nr:glycosyltransferase [Vicinamibacterales bacterium]
MKFAFITPRYGAEFSNGAEHACRLLAEQLAKRHDVDVLTTTARDSSSWKHEYSEGSDRVRGALVRRFAVGAMPDRSTFAELSRRLREGPRYRPDELSWLRHVGPWSSGLFEHLKRQHRSYDALVFFGLWQPLTVSGLEIAPERSVLFPHLQLRPELRFDLWADVLTAPRAVGYFANSERRLVHSYVGAIPQAEEVIGIGVDPPPQQSYPRHQQDPADVITQEDDSSADEDAPNSGYLEGRGVPFRRRHRLYDNFALYGGRVEPDNGCEEMLEYFDTFATDRDEDMRLVLMGVKMMTVPEAPYLRLAGVLPDRERMTAYEAASVTIAPASDDLLSQSLLESLAVGTPVLANASNEAAVEHCRRANAGLYYSNREEFVGALAELQTPALRERMGENGRRYIKHHHQWDAVLGRFERLVGRVRRLS